MKKTELISFANAGELARAVASAWLDEIVAANRAGKSYCVALSGGRIAQEFFMAVVEQAKARKIGDGDPGFADSFAEASALSLPLDRGNFSVHLCFDRV